MIGVHNFMPFLSFMIQSYVSFPLLRCRLLAPIAVQGFEVWLNADPADGTSASINSGIEMLLKVLIFMVSVLAY